MKQFVSRLRRPCAAPVAPDRAGDPASDLERLFGVSGMRAGKRVKMRPGMALFASDIPVREQVWIGLQFAALGLVPPAIFGALLLGFVWLR